MFGPRRPRLTSTTLRRRLIRSRWSWSRPGVAVPQAPVDALLVAEPRTLDELLALEQHRDARGGHDEGAAERRPLLRRPAVRVARPDLLGDAGGAVGVLVVRFRVDDPLERIGRIDDEASARPPPRCDPRRSSARARPARRSRSRRPTGRRSRRPRRPPAASRPGRPACPRRSSGGRETARPARR